MTNIGSVVLAGGGTAAVTETSFHTDCTGTRTQAHRTPGPSLTLRRGRVLCRADSAHYGHAFVGTAWRHGVWFSVTVRMDPTGQGGHRGHR